MWLALSPDSDTCCPCAWRLPVPSCSEVPSEIPGRQTWPVPCREAILLTPSTGEGPVSLVVSGCWPLAGQGRVGGPPGGPTLRGKRSLRHVHGSPSLLLTLCRSLKRLHLPEGTR